MPRKAAATAVVEEEFEETEGTTTRRILGDRGHLQDAVQTVINKVLTGEIVIADKKPLTPHRVARLIQEWKIDNGEKDAELPSTGAVSAMFKRWEEYGYATFTQNPLAFKAYTAAGRRHGLEGVLAKRAETRKAERLAAKAEAAGEPLPAKKAPRKRAAKKVAATAS